MQIQLDSPIHILSQKAVESGRKLDRGSSENARAFGPVLDTQRRLLSAQIRSAPNSAPDQMFQPTEQASTPRAKKIAHDSAEKITAQEFKGKVQFEKSNPGQIPAVDERGGVATDATSRADARPSDSTKPQVDAGIQVKSERPMDAAPTSKSNSTGSETVDQSLARPIEKPSPAAASVATIPTPPRISTEVTPAKMIGRVLNAMESSEAKSTTAVRGNPAPTPQGPTRQSASKSPVPNSNQESAPQNKASASAVTSTLDQLIKAFKLRAGEKTSSAVMRVHPPDLGNMRIDVSLEEASLRVEITTKSQAARDVVADRSDQLRLALAQQGIRIDQLNVVVAAPEVGSVGYFRDQREKRNAQSGGDSMKFLESPVEATQQSNSLPFAENPPRRALNKRLDFEV